MTTRDVVGLTVEECVGRLAYNVKLGSERGSAFVFCGNLSKLDADALDKSVCDLYERTAAHAESVIENLSAKKTTYKAFAEEVGKKRERRIKKLLDDSSRALSAEEKAELDEAFDTSDDAYKKWLSARNRKIKSAKKTRHSSLEKLKKYTTIRDRKILACYWSVDEVDTMILIYDGDERGCVWTSDEYRKGGNFEDMSV